jgi:hypothetical protein
MHNAKAMRECKWKALLGSQNDIENSHVEWSQVHLLVLPEMSMDKDYLSSITKCK